MRRLIASFLCLASAQGLLAQCDCIDKGDIKERLKRDQVAIQAYSSQLQKMGRLPCTPENRAALQEIVGDAMFAAKTPGRIPLNASGNTTNNCDIEVTAPTKCLEAAIRIHEEVHQKACNATWAKHQALILAGQGKNRFEALGLPIASYIAEEIEGYTAEMRFLYDQLARLERDCKTPPQRHYTPGGGLELRGDPGPAATGTVNPRSGDPLAPPPMPKAKSMPQPKPID